MTYSNLMVLVKVRENLCSEFECVVLKISPGVTRRAQTKPPVLTLAGYSLQFYPLGKDNLGPNALEGVTFLFLVWVTYYSPAPPLKML